MAPHHLVTRLLLRLLLTLADTQTLASCLPICATRGLDSRCGSGRSRPCVFGRNRTIRTLLLGSRSLPSDVQAQYRGWPYRRYRHSLPEKLQYVCAINKNGGRNDLTWDIGRFLGIIENEREVQMDMREMVDKVKKGEPLYGHSTLSPYMQGVAARNSRFSSLLAHVIPWANFVNHNQVRQVLYCTRRGH